MINGFFVKELTRQLASSEAINKFKTRFWSFFSIKFLHTKGLNRLTQCAVAAIPNRIPIIQLIT